MNYYNEHDPKIAAWLEGLIAAGLIPSGHVDTRSIVDVSPGDLAGFKQCHFFAGIGGWSLALRLAGWPEDRPVWTGSCPCQPYSVAGKGKGNADDRNLWPAFFRLIRERRPDVVFGEQVESAVGHGWLDGIRADLEGEGYACGDATLGAHSVGAPHIRQRLYWVADSAMHAGAQHEHEQGRGLRRPAGPCDSAECRGDHGRLADSENIGLQRCSDSAGTRGVTSAAHSGRRDCGLGHSTGREQRRQWESAEVSGRENETGRPGAWDDCRLIQCRDGKLRRIPTEPALFPLADGLPYRVGKRGSVRPALLHGAGNAIVPQVAAEFIKAFITIFTTLP